jgi:NitT/TauT family transport system substrate-binding protein
MMACLRLLVLIALVSAACSTEEAPATLQGLATTAPEVQRLTFATNSELAFSTVPAVAAFEAMKEDGTGVEVEVLELEDTQVALQALLSDEADFAILDIETLPAANARGADLRVFFVGQNNEWLLVSRSDITSPEELDAARIGYGSSGSTTWWLLVDAAERYGVTPTYLAVPGSENRVTALLAGEIDASALTYADFEALERQAPGEFHILLDFEQEAPGIITGDNMMATQSRLDEAEASFKIITEYLVEHYRRAGEDPEWLAEQALKHFPDGNPDEFLASAQALATANVFQDDGGLSGLTPENIDTLQEAMIVIEAITEADVQTFESLVDLRFLEAANQ